MVHGYHIYKSEVCVQGKTFLCVELVTDVRPEITLRFVHCFSNLGGGGGGGKWYYHMKGLR